MGKVRQGFIKRLAHQIDNEHHDEVTDSFCLNADLIDEYYELSSIRFRNRVAGYLVSVYKNRDNDYESVRKSMPSVKRKGKKKKRSKKK